VYRVQGKRTNADDLPLPPGCPHTGKTGGKTGENRGKPENRKTGDRRLPRLLL
jgi:hypothetical protein